MSASPHLPPTVGRDGGPGRASRETSGRHPQTRLLVRSVLPLVLLAGCSSDGPDVATEAPSPTGSPSVTATPSASSEQELVLGQYRKFWASLTAVSRMPAAERRAALAPYTVDPQLKSLLAGMAATDKKGQVFYGADKPRATQASISSDGARAVIDDCQDSTGAGVADLKSGKRLTFGSARNHVVVTMQRVDSEWKVYFVSYTQKPC